MKTIRNTFVRAVTVLSLLAMPVGALADAGPCPCGTSCPCGAGCPCGH
jgi:hypothetical protein